MTTSLIWVTGASRGLGRALASSVPWPNSFVVGVSRTEPEEAAIDEFVQADLSTQAGWDALARSLKHTIASTPDIERAVLIHAAATLHPMGFAGETDPVAYQAAVLLNTVAPQVIGRSFLGATSGLNCERYLLMLTTGSSGGHYEGWSSYKAGKAAVDAWVEAESELRANDPKVRVLAVAPGIVNTDMQDAIRAADLRDFPRREEFITLQQEDRLADPADVARQIWDVLASGSPVGPVIDLRDLDK